MSCQRTGVASATMSSTLMIGALDVGYDAAERAPALAGVPRSTLYDWARTELLIPSVSAEREKLSQLSPSPARESPLCAFRGGSR